MTQALIEKAKPKAIQQPSAYLTRSVFRFHDPTGLSAGQWRLIAREPINRSAQRFIIRELSALEWIITSSKRKDPRVDEYTQRWDEMWEDGDGFRTWLSRSIEDACSLPFGGASEVGYRGQDLDWVQHVDAATLLPTYEKAVPYCQVNPDNWTQRVYFRRGQLRRLRVNPRPDIRFKEYQIAPTEDGFTEIEALSKIYLYYMQELTDTVPLGILDVMDWTEVDAMEWAKGFREMMEGVDPLKIPILYNHTGQAKFIQFGRSPQDLNVVDQFKRFAEVLLSKYGLSIGDLRLFEHQATKAGERVSQLVTERSGIGFWAALISGFITRLLPEGLTFEFKQPRPERELVVANRKAAQLRMLQEATGIRPLISVKDAIEEAQALELFTTKVVPLEESQPPPPNGGPPKLPPRLPDGETEEERDQMADQDLSKALFDVRPLVEKQLGPGWRHPEPPAVERLEELVQRAFENSAETIDEANVGEVITLLQPLEKGGAGSGHWGHTGRLGERGGSPQRQVGITSHREGEHEDIRQVRGEMHQFRAKLKAIPGVSNVNVEEGRGAWAGGGEPTWITTYEGNSEALALIAQTGKRFNQDSVLVMDLVTGDHPNAQPFDHMTFGAQLDAGSRQAVEETLVAQDFGGWTWSKDPGGNSMLQIACVPQWGGDAETHSKAVDTSIAELASAGITIKRSRTFIDPTVMDDSNYDDFIGQK